MKLGRDVEESKIGDEVNSYSEPSGILIEFGAKPDGGLCASTDAQYIHVVVEELEHDPYGVGYVSLFIKPTMYINSSADCSHGALSISKMAGMS